MRRIFALLPILIVLMASKTYASSASVNINNSMNTSSDTTYSNTSTTHVKIETDGEVKEFNTNGDQSVDWKSDDGNSSVKINNNGANVKVTGENDETVSPTSSPSGSPTPTPLTAKDDKKSDDGNAFMLLVDLFKHIFSFL